MKQPTALGAADMVVFLTVRMGAAELIASRLAAIQGIAAEQPFLNQPVQSTVDGGFADPMQGGAKLLSRDVLTGVLLEKGEDFFPLFGFISFFHGVFSPARFNNAGCTLGAAAKQSLLRVKSTGCPAKSVRIPPASWSTMEAPAKSQGFRFRSR